MANFCTLVLCFLFVASVFAQSNTYLYNIGPICAVELSSSGVHQYSTYAPNYHNITSITFYCGNYLDGMTIQYSDRSTATVGSPNDAPNSFKVDLNSNYITKVSNNYN